MAYQRNMAKGETMRLDYVPDQPRMNQTLMSTTSYEPGGEPVRQGDVSARITAPSGKSETVRFRSDGEEWGTFAGRFDPHEPGKYRVTLTCKQTKAIAGDLVPRSRVSRPNAWVTARPAGSPGEEIARVTRGKVIRADKVAEIVQSLADLPEPPPLVRRVQLVVPPGGRGHAGRDALPVLGRAEMDRVDLMILSM